jgi:hypothetical protein
MNDLRIERLVPSHMTAIQNRLWERSEKEWTFFGLDREWITGVLNLPEKWSRAVLCDDGVVCAFGAYETKHPGIWETWFVGSDLFPLRGRDVTKLFRIALREGVAEELPSELRAVSWREGENDDKVKAWFHCLGFDVADEREGRVIYRYRMGS